MIVAKPLFPSKQTTVSCLMYLVYKNNKVKLANIELDFYLQHYKL